jgi:hypothetical protein
MFYFVAAGDNTTTVTLNIDGLGAKAVTRDGSVALAAGDIKSGEVVVVVYDGTRFQVVSQLNSSGDARFANVSIASALNVGGVATVTGGSVLNGGVVINEPGADVDFRVEGDTDANLIFADASTDRVGVGTSTPGTKLHVTGSDGLFVQFLNSTNNTGAGLVFGSGTNLGRISTNGASTAMSFEINAVEKARLDSSGNLGLGVTPSAWNASFLGFQMAAGISLWTSKTTNSVQSAYFSNNLYYDGARKYLNTGAAAEYVMNGAGAHQWFTAPSGTAGNAITFTQAMTLDASGNLGVGTTSPNVGAWGRAITLQGPSNAAYEVTDGTVRTAVYANAGSTGGVSVETNHPLVFATNATERARISSTGVCSWGQTTASLVSNGMYFTPGGAANDAHLAVANTSSNSTDALIYINRQSSDGNLIEFRQANTAEGTISVSGTTVSYNGGHLSRWSQFTDGSTPALLKGTVMSNLDQMAVWINPETGEQEANEQLNCMKVSNVEGDENVAGVFVSYSESDLNVAMTGDMIIRIAQGVVVQRGDLLMSAGDGTAKPQGDDIRRSKTIAKVTSNHVTCTYEDGSYCVPCVLMAC